MKRIPLLTFLALAPVVAEAQTENHVVPVNTTRQAKEILVIKRHNRGLCTRFNLAFPCTQAAVCTAHVAAGGAVTGGASCTAAAARTAGIRIYDHTISGS